MERLGLKIGGKRKKKVKVGLVSLFAYTIQANFHFCSNHICFGMWNTPSTM